MNFVFGQLVMLIKQDYFFLSKYSMNKLKILCVVNLLTLIPIRKAEVCKFPCLYVFVTLSFRLPWNGNRLLHKGDYENPGL